MKTLTTLLALTFAITMAMDCTAQRNKGQGKSDKGSRQKSMQRGERQRGGDDAQGRRQADPEKLAAKMLEEFDSNGDEKLNARELAALLTSMRDRRGRGSAQDGQQGRRGQGKPGADRAKGERDKEGGKRGKGRKGEDMKRGKDAPGDGDSGKKGGRRGGKKRGQDDDSPQVSQGVSPQKPPSGDTN